MATLPTVGVTIIMPWTPLGTLFGFRPLPLSFILVLGGIVVFYFFSAVENVKECFTAAYSFSCQGEAVMTLDN